MPLIDIIMTINISCNNLTYSEIYIYIYNIYYYLYVSGIGNLRVGKELVQIEVYKKRIMMNKIKTISNHFIICGTTEESRCIIIDI